MIIRLNSVPHGVPRLCFSQASTLPVPREAQPTELPPGRGRKEIAIGEGASTSMITFFASHEGRSELMLGSLLPTNFAS